MQIQFNTDNNVEGHEDLTESLTQIINDQLDRFSNQITRLEVHLSDVDGSKNGVNDKRCLLEARLQGLQPIAVSNVANSKVLAVRGAVDKMKTSLSTTIGKLRKY
jgi:ribosome-associated translation inhibitor RaiA